MSRHKEEERIMGYLVSTVREAEEVYARLRDVQSEEAAIEVMRGVPRSVFFFIDEKPGYLDGKYGSEEHPGFMYLRRARNNPESKLFEVLV